MCDASQWCSLKLLGYKIGIVGKFAVVHTGMEEADKDGSYWLNKVRPKVSFSLSQSNPLCCLYILKGYIGGVGSCIRVGIPLKYPF